MVQLAVLLALIHLGVAAPLADAVGFFLAAQLNFVLSSLVTWRDRPALGGRGLVARWLAYNGTALVSLGINTAIFGAVHEAVGVLPAASLGVAGGMVFTFLVCNTLVFRSRGNAQPDTAFFDSTPLPRGDGNVRDIRSARKRLSDVAAAVPPAPEPTNPKLDPFKAPTESSSVLSGPQVVALVTLLIAVALGLWLVPLLTLIVINAGLVVFFLSSNLLKLYLIRRSYSARGGSAISVPPDVVGDEELPVYTILLPVYHESAVVSQLMTGIARLNYPSDRLDVKILLEWDDIETREAVRDIDLPWAEVLIVPDVGPKGKPRACNFGLARARGEFVVIYDAEDRPEPDQLRKAVAAFKLVEPEVVCLQAKLNYFNRAYNVLTRWFTAEYSMWFDQLLPGLQSLNAPIPLGGTSNHFVTSRLHALGGWNAYNVTEDADLGMRIFFRGWKTAILDSTTYEEATSRTYNWLRQRSRWVKGYMQTYLFFMRHPVRLARAMGFNALLVFQLFFGAATLGLLINPFFWLLTVAWYATHLSGIEQVFPWPVLYASTFALFFGNALFALTMIMGCFRRRNYEDVKWAVFAPVYWILMSIGAWKGFIQLCYKPQYWEKTEHGFCAYDPATEDEVGGSEAAFRLANEAYAEV